MLELLKTLPWWGWGLSIFTLALVSWSIGVWYYASKLETPDYTISKKTSSYELREYEPILVIQTTTSGTANQGMNKGFSVLAGYIFGGNTRRDSIKMTTPVLDRSQSIKMTTPVLDQPVSDNIKMTTPVLDQASDDERVITFTIPKKWTKDSLPIPNDDRVHITEWPAQTKAVKRFKSFSTFSQKARELAATELLAALDKDNISHKGDVTYAFYNPPWTPWFLRRNEVMVTLSD